MKKTTILFITLVISVLTLMTFARRSRPQMAQSQPETDPSSKVLSAASSDQAHQSQTQEFGAVEVKVTPQELLPGEKMIFKLSLNTHSVELDYDYTGIASLQDDQGDSYQALTWDGGQSGHHITGQISFEPLKQGAKSITLKLSGIDNQTNSFTWQVLK